LVVLEAAQVACVKGSVLIVSVAAAAGNAEEMANIKAKANVVTKRIVRKRNDIYSPQSLNRYLVEKAEC
jgi:hypothetical protein